MEGVLFLPLSNRKGSRHLLVAISTMWTSPRSLPTMAIVPPSAKMHCFANRRIEFKEKDDDGVLDGKV